MEVISLLAIFAATTVIVASVPALAEGQVPANTADQEQRDYYRDKRSQYQYLSPCGAAASSPIPAIAPAAYPVNLSPYHPYATPHNYYGVPHYRSAEFEPEPELLNFSDMEHMMSEHVPMARYGYAVPAPHVPGYAAPFVPPATTGPAFGVFPNANTGGCSVPLLFSCAPSIVPGHVVQSPPHGYGNSYRGVETMAPHNSQEHREEPTVHDQLNPVHDQNHAIVHQ